MAVTSSRPSSLIPKQGEVAGTWSWLRFPSFGRRIALAIVLAVIAVQGQAFLQMWLFSDLSMRLTGTRWLAETIAGAVRDAMALPEPARSALLEERSQGLPVTLHWNKTRPWPLAPDVDPLAGRMLSTLREVLGADAQTVDAIPVPLTYRFPIDAVRIELAPPSIAADLGTAAVHAGEPEVLVPLSLRLAVQARDGTWVSADPIGFGNSPVSRFLPITALLTGAGIVTMVSALMARRIMVPLDRLVVAAEAVGTSRELVPVPTEGLGEFAAVARAFEDMQQRLIRFVSDRTQMLAAISHDLRSALTRMRIMAESGTASAAILAEVDDMEAMLASTLAFASGEAQAVPSEPVDIAALLISLVDDAADAGGRCIYRGPDHCVVTGHPLSLKRSFNNLLDNALKYGDVARVTLKMLPASVRITVADDGPGIPAELVEEAFRPFRRLDPARSGQPGAGLGLTIARDAIGSHGGTIALEPGPERGLVATITLPQR